MALIDEKGKLFGLINLIDLLIILFLVAVFALGAKIIFFQPKVHKKAVVIIRLKNVSAEGANSIKKGDKVALEITGPIVGTVVDVKVKPAQIESPDYSGQIVLSQSKLNKDVDVVIEGDATINKRSIKLNGVEVKAEMKRTLSSKKYEIPGQIISVYLKD
jgi:hypothetical protein